MLQLSRSASAIVTVAPDPHVPFQAFEIEVFEPGSVYRAGLGSVDSGVHSPVAYAAAATRILKVDPGGLSSRLARLSRGFGFIASSASYAVSAWLALWTASVLASKPGVETIARMRPVDGSTATAAPWRSPSPS